MTLQAGTPIGKYVVRRKIAEGGMAEIYLASSVGPEGFEKDVVIKRIRAFLATDPGFVEMFIAEARLASKLNHANVVQIFDFDKHEDTYYLAMEFVRGHSLWDARKRSKERMEPMPPTLVAHVGAEVARGLAYAHRVSDRGRPLNLVHRDVTPHNVLLSFDGAVKLTDFGVAKAGNSQTAAGVLKGKFAYMSPEQSRGEPVDARTDVFALGIVLWEMLTGGRLFDGDTDVAVLRAVQDRVIAPPTRLNAAVPPDLDAVVMKALERDLSRRYQSAAELERGLAETVFRNAKSLEDRDVGAYLRKLFPEEAEERVEGTHARASAVSAPAPGTAAKATPPPREPTAIMGGGKATPAPVSPDEDFHAATHVVDRPKGPDTLPMPSLHDRPAPQRKSATPALAVPSEPSVVVEPMSASGVSQVRVSPEALQEPAPKAKASVLFGVVALVVIASATGFALFGRSGDSSSGMAPSAEPVAATTVVRPVDRQEAPANSTSAGVREGESARAAPSTSADALGGKSAQPATPPTTDPVATSPSMPGGTDAEPSAPEQGTEAQAESQAALDAAVAEKTAAKSAPVVARREGTVTLTVIPYAAVFVDGKKYLDEVSRTRKIKLPAGKHRLVLRHAVKGDKAFDFTLEPGGNVSLSHNFIKP